MTESLRAQAPSAHALVASGGIRFNLLYMALVPGLGAMLLYYAGMKRTPALVVTFVELLFPVGAVILNWIFLDSPLSMFQVAAAAALLLAVTRISFLKIES